MKREILSDVIRNIDEDLIAEADHFDPARCNDSSERIVNMSKKKFLTIGIAAAFVLAMGTGAYAYYRYHLNDVIVATETTAAIQAPVSEGSKTETEQTEKIERTNVLSLQGLAGSNEFKAMQEWHEFEENYDKDHSILDKVGNKPTEWDEKYSAAGYFVYSQDMADKIDSIAEKYGLKLHTAIKGFETLQEFEEKFGKIIKTEEASGYYFDDGTFQVSADLNGKSCQIRKTVKGVLDTVSLNIFEEDKYKQWEYKTESGVTVLLANSPEGSLIIADLKDSFVAVNVLSFLEEDGLSDKDLEAIADQIDFSKI